MLSGMGKGPYVCIKSEYSLINSLNESFIRGCYAPGDVVGLASYESYRSTLQSRVRRFIRREIARHSRFIRQFDALDKDVRAFLVIRRCLRYGDRVPRKYRRAYGEVIRSMRSIEGVKML